MSAYCPEVRQLAQRWRGEVGAIADAMYEYLGERIPVAAADADPELAALTRASCTSNVETVLAMLGTGIPASATEAPVTALEHARLMAQRGAEVNDTLRFYRLGQGHFLRAWTQDLVASGAGPERLVAAIEETTSFMIEYIDVVSSRVSAEHLAERERRQRRAAVVRADVVRMLLAGEVEDLAAAERTLGRRLDRPQLAFLVWTATGAPLERAASAVAEAIGDPRPLLVPDDPRTLGGWATPPGPGQPDRAVLDACAGGLDPGVRVAFGGPGAGAAGFRTSRDEAERARRVAELTGRAAPAATWFADVALLDLLTGDPAAARRFALAELGALGGAGPALAEVRRTVLAVVQPRGGVAAAARATGVHRNTVLQRIHRAEALLGRSLDERTEELHAALVLAGGAPVILLEDGRGA